MNQPLSPMRNWIVRFRVKGINSSSETVVRANNSSQARELVKAQYAGSEVTILSVNEE